LDISIDERKALHNFGFKFYPIFGATFQDLCLLFSFGLTKNAL
jgi:hypothetical protein